MDRRQNSEMHMHYNVSANDFVSAGEASSQVKKILKQLGVSPEATRKVAISMYEAELNMVIHAFGGEIDVDMYPEKICICLRDKGPGIPDLKLAMQEGYSTASDEVRAMGFGAGMGLPNMKRYSDVLHIDTKVGEGTAVTITVYFK